MAERRFDPREVKRILKRAEELQSPVPAGLASAPTLLQLQEAASELGLSPDAVAQAAGEIDIEPERNSFWALFWGGPTSVERTHVVSAPMPAEARPAIIQKIRAVTGLTGEAKILDGAIEFGHSKPDTGESFHVAVIPEGERTRLSVRASYCHSLAYYMFVMFPAVPLLVLIARAREQTVWTNGAGEIVTLEVLCLLVATVVCFLSARGLVQRTVRRGRRAIDDLIKTLTSDLERRASTPSLQRGGLLAGASTEDDAIHTELRAG